MHNMKKSPQHSSIYRHKLGEKDLHFEDQNQYSERECRICRPRRAYGQDRERERALRAFR